MADSRPDPGPCTRTCTRLTPWLSASRAHCSAATVAANGVLFLEPLKPALPDEPHDTVFPWVSVMVMVVLLNVALMCATPSASTTRFAFFPMAMLGCHPERSEGSALRLLVDERYLKSRSFGAVRLRMTAATWSLSSSRRSPGVDPSSCA